MILHLFLGDLYIEKFPSSLKFLKLVVNIDECREHSISSDLYLSDNIVRFNQTVHFPVKDDETSINEVHLSLVSIRTDIAENLLGFAKFVCTTGEHSITKTVNLHDYRGVLVGKVPVTSFYYSSAIKLGDRVMFKPSYAPNAKEYSFLLSRKFRDTLKAKPVTFNDDIEHRLNNEARDLISRDFRIVSSSSKATQKKKSAVSTAISVGTGKSAAKDSMTYSPGMTRNGAMSDAARGRVAKKMPIGGTNAKKMKSKAHVSPAQPPKLRTTYMSVGYVKEKQWPEKSTGATQRDLYRIQQASEMKLQILKDIALTVKQKNLRTQARQDAIRAKKMQVEVDEGKLKRVLIRKENEIQLLKGTLTHLRYTNALQQDIAPKKKQQSGGVHAFSRLDHMSYPNPSDSSFRRSGTPTPVRRASTPKSALRSNSAGAQRRRSTGSPVARSGSTRRNSGQGVSFFGDLSRSSTPAPVLYHPFSSTKSPYDSRKRPNSAAGYRRPSQEELVDQLSDIFDTDFREDQHNHLHTAQAPLAQAREFSHGAAGKVGSSGKHIAKDWLASARASINEFHRQPHAKSPVGIAARSPPQRGVSTQEIRTSRTKSGPNAAPNRSRGSSAAASTSPDVSVPAPQPEAPPAHSSRVSRASEAVPRRDTSGNHFHLDSDSASEEDQRRFQEDQSKVAVPGFLNAFAESGMYQGGDFQSHAAEGDTTVSSIAVADIPYMPNTNSSWRDAYSRNEPIVVPVVPRESATQSHRDNSVVDPPSPDSLGGGDSSHAPPTALLQSTMGRSSRPVSATVAKQLQRNQQYALQSTSNAQSTSELPVGGRESRDSSRGLTRNHRGEPLLSSTSQSLDDFAKSQFSIRGNALSSASQRTGSITKQNIARRMEKNRLYDPRVSAPSSASVPVSAPPLTNTATETQQEVADEDSEQADAVDALNTSLSEQLKLKVREVFENVGALEERVGTMRQQRREDRVPQGWVRRTSATTTTVTTGAALSTLSTNSTSAQARTTAVLDSAADSDSPAEEDLKMRFEDVSSDSSSSGEFDLLTHKKSRA